MASPGWRVLIVAPGVLALLLAAGSVATPETETAKARASVELERIVPFLDVVVLPSTDSSTLPVAEGEPPCERSMVVLSPAVSTFQFSEREYENGCASVRYLLEVPPGALSLKVSFFADRDVVRADIGGAPSTGRLVQALRIWEPTDRQEVGFQPRGATESPLHSWELFPSEAGAEDRRAFTFDAQVMGPRPLLIEWWFQDAGALQPVDDMAFPAPQALRSAVSDIRIGMSDVGLALQDSMTVDARTIGTDVTRTLHRAFVVSEGLHAATANGTLGIDVVVPAGEVLETVLAPDGARVPFEPRGGSTTGTLDGAWLGTPGLAAAGPGAYRLVTAHTQPQEVAPLALLWAIPLLALPAAIGTRTLLTSRRWQARPAATGARRYAAVHRGAVAGLAVWAGIIVVMSSLGHFPAVAGLPSGGLATTYLSTLALLALVLLLLHQHAARTRVSVLQSSEADLQDRMKDLHTFLHGVTHDLKTPLIALQWLTKDLEDGLQKAGQDTATRRSLQRIMANIGGMEMLVGDLLTLARIDQEDVRAEPDADLAAIMHEVVGRLEEERARRNARIQWRAVSIAYPLPAARLRLVLQNLIGNAIKYGRDESGTVWVTARDEGRHVVLEVADDGPGVAEADKDRILAMFQRGTDVAERDIPGTGMGLAIVARIVAAADGRLEVRNAPAGGALFRVSVPRRS